MSPSPTRIPSSLTAAPTGRLAFLDGLRAVAVVLVLAQHSLERLDRGLADGVDSVLNLGLTGVAVFFLCSGFIIPATLERRGSLRDFWISRFFRLYPLYWLTLAAAFLLSRVVPISSDGAMTPTAWLADVTMAQSFVRQPNALALYWTLGFEMAFYLLGSVLLVLHAHRHTGTVLAILTVASVGYSARTYAAGGQPTTILLVLSLMVVGTAGYRRWAGQMSTPRWAACLGIGVVHVLVVAGLAVRGGGQPIGQAGATATSWLAALLVFVVGATCWRVVPRAVRRLGVISYSVYLLQAFAFILVPVVEPAPWLTPVLWVGLTLLASTYTYRLVERPAIALGRRIADGQDDRPVVTVPRREALT